MENSEVKGVKLSGTLQSIIGVGGGDGVALANQVTLWTTSIGKRAIIRKIMATNRTPGPVWLWIGYGDLTVAASVFRQVLPSIRLINGFDTVLMETEIPIGGNMPEGFTADTTAVTGTNGNIIAESSAAAAAPNDVQVKIEVEEI